MFIKNASPNVKLVTAFKPIYIQCTAVVYDNGYCPNHIFILFFPSLTADSENQNGTTSEEKQEDEGEGEGEGEEETAKEEDEEDDKVPNAAADSSSSSPTSKPYSCHWCKKGFAYKCRMRAHVKRCPMSQAYERQCPECPAKLPNQRALQRHQAVAHRNTARVKKKVACDLCGRTFAHPSGENRLVHGEYCLEHTLHSWM